jgi:hypothetical protein
MYRPSTYVCDINAERCRPFEDQAVVFRCPKNCDAAKITSPVFIGDQIANHRSLVVGGSDLDRNLPAVYRGDSFPCAAAIHSGHIDRRTAGCAVLVARGSHSNYPSQLHNGIRSLGFDASFPLSFILEKAGSISRTPACQDPRDELLVFTVATTLLYTALTFTRRLAPPAEFFGVIFCILFFHVALVSDSPEEPQYLIFDNVISVTFERFLPACFVMYTLYQIYISHTMSGSSFRLRILWLTSAWIGALQNIIFSLPLPRLTRVDLNEQIGAKFALSVIVVLVVVIGCYQTRILYQAGQLKRVVKTYLMMAVILMLLWFIPGQELRIHHYTYILLFLPATEVPSVSSHIISGFLVGLFINGIARWGFASVLETLTALFPTRSFGSPIPDLMPTIDNSTITFEWSHLPDGWSGVQAVINDVAMSRMYNDGGAPISFTRHYVLGTTTYFRFSFVRYDQWRGLVIGTSSAAGKLTSLGEWIAPRA